jgi:2-polyprenyl-3-methyl-5-hydroxy-6-metoxy-1,4-benzoquinol methylase
MATVDLFNEKAKSWDNSKRKKLTSLAIASSILKHITLNKQMEVMDFGAGTGLISAYVAPFVGKIIAVDISKAMLEKLKLKPELQVNVNAVCQDITSNPLNNQFDLIISALALHHVENTNNLISTFAAHLKIGAKVALVDLDKEDGSFHPPNTNGVFHFGFDRAELHILLEKNGFKDIEFHTAYTMNKNDKHYPLFLVIATKG